MIKIINRCAPLLISIKF